MLFVGVWDMERLFQYLNCKVLSDSIFLLEKVSVDQFANVCNFGICVELEDWIVLAVMSHNQSCII